MGGKTFSIDGEFDFTTCIMFRKKILRIIWNMKIYIGIIIFNTL